MAKYDDFRDQIKSGDVLAWTHKGWKTWHDIKIQLVRFFTQSEYSHVGIAWVVAGRVFVIESVIPYIRIVPLSTNLPVYWIPVEKDWNKEAEEYAMKLVGVGNYSQLEAIAAGLGLDTPESNGNWQCAKFVKAVLKRAGLEFTGPDTPSDVVEDACTLSPMLLLK